MIRCRADDQPFLWDHDSDVLQRRCSSKEHGVPHFHARYGGKIAVFTVESLERLRGELPRRAERLVREWAELSKRADAKLGAGASG
jgi:Domain of unknown function (DUF4160)